MVPLVLNEVEKGKRGTQSSAGLRTVRGTKQRMLGTTKPSFPKQERQQCFFFEYLYLLSIVSYANLHVKEAVGDPLKALGSHTVKSKFDRSAFTC